MLDVNYLSLVNVFAIKEEFDLDNSLFPVLLELNPKTSEIISGKVIYTYEDVNEEGTLLGELI